jgi:adenylosuccinate lyase
MPILPIDTGRYGSPEVRHIFEEENRLKCQLDFEAAVAAAQGETKIIPAIASKEIVTATRSGNIKLKRIKELESTTEHDTAAFVEALSEQCSPKAQPWVHYGLTSNDITDTSTSIQMKQVFGIIETKILDLSTILIRRATEFRTLPAVGRTHGQHSSIIAFGLKFAVWAAEMARHIERIEEGKKRFLLCKTLGVVGTGSLMGEKALDVQKKVAGLIGLYPVDAATQIVSREGYAEMQFLIALIGSTLDKMAIEIRNLQRTELGEVAEPFKLGQIGSSAVPVKRNPIKSERVSSLAKLLRSLVSVAMENILLWHERDLSNSANERFTLPMASILLDEMLNSMKKVIAELVINSERILSNLEMTNGQIYAEFILDALIKKGIPRFEAFRNIQRIAFSAQKSREPFVKSLARDPAIARYLTIEELKDIFNPKNHLSASSNIIDNVEKQIILTKKKISR